MGTNVLGFKRFMNTNFLIYQTQTQNVPHKSSSEIFLRILTCKCTYHCRIPDLNSKVWKGKLALFEQAGAATLQPKLGKICNNLCQTMYLQNLEKFLLILSRDKKE